MARPLRIQRPGALYHVLNRGNYRKALFDTPGAARAFETGLIQTCARCGWIVHAHVVMSNHYHIALETPEPNLVTGMHWLQCVFGNRFNRHRRERGHVFQGRYKSLLVGPHRSLLGLINYIHLNPVRAGLCRLEDLRRYPYSSFPRLWATTCPKPWSRSRLLAALDLPDDAASMQAYQKHLACSEENDPAQQDALGKRYSQGWYIAHEHQRHALLPEIAPLIEPAGHACKPRQLRCDQWEIHLLRELQAHGLERTALSQLPKADPRKIAIARSLRTQTTTPLAWIAHQLAMGKASYVCQLIHR